MIGTFPPSGASLHLPIIPPSLDSIERIVAPLFVNLDREEIQQHITTALKVDGAAFNRFLINVKQGPENFATKSTLTDRYYYPKAFVFFGLRAFIEGKISESMLVDIILLWSNVNFFKQKPAILSKQDFDAQIRQYQLEDAVSNPDVWDSEKRIYTFKIEQPETDDGCSYYLNEDSYSVPNVESEATLPPMMKKIFNIIQRIYGRQSPFYFYHKGYDSNWRLRVPSFYLQQRESERNGIKLRPQIDLSSEDRIADLFSKNAHPFALPFPERSNNALRCADGLDTGEEYYPGVPLHDAYHAFIKGLGVSFGFYKITNDYLNHGLVALRAQVEKRVDCRNSIAKGLTDSFFKSYKSMLVDSEINEAMGEVLNQREPDEHRKHQKNKLFLFEQYVASMVKILYQGKNPSLKDTDVVQIQTEQRAIDTICELAFTSIAKHIFPKEPIPELNPERLQQFYFINGPHTNSILRSLNQCIFMHAPAPECVVV